MSTDLSTNELQLSETVSLLALHLVFEKRIKNLLGCWMFRASLSAAGADNLAAAARQKETRR